MIVKMNEKNMFLNIPFEIFKIIIDEMRLKEFNNFSLCSKKLNKRINNFRKNKNCPFVLIVNTLESNIRFYFNYEKLEILILQYENTFYIKIPYENKKQKIKTIFKHKKFNYIKKSNYRTKDHIRLKKFLSDLRSRKMKEIEKEIKSFIEIYNNNLILFKKLNLKEII